MCYNAKASALAATIGILSACVAFSLKEWVVGGLILIYSFMQVSEFLIWRGLDTGSVDLNRRGTWLASTTLRLHAIVVLVVLLVVKWKSLESNRRFALVGLLAISLFDWWRTTSTAPALLTTEPGCAKGCRLDWKFGSEYPIQILIIALALLIGTPRLIAPVTVFYGGAVLLTLILTAVDSKTTFRPGTVWCFFSAIFAPLLVGYLWWNNREH